GSESRPTGPSRSLHGPRAARDRVVTDTVTAGKSEAIGAITVPVIRHNLPTGGQSCPHGSHLERSARRGTRFTHKIAGCVHRPRGRVCKSYGYGPRRIRGADQSHGAAGYAQSGRLPAPGVGLGTPWIRLSPAGRVCIIRAAHLPRCLRRLPESVGRETAVR